MKLCRQCSAGFEITPDDLAFYDKVSPVIAYNPIFLKLHFKFAGYKIEI